MHQYSCSFTLTHDNVVSHFTLQQKRVTTNYPVLLLNVPHSIYRTVPTVFTVGATFRPENLGKYNKLQRFLMTQKHV